MAQIVEEVEVRPPDLSTFYTTGLSRTLRRNDGDRERPLSGWHRWFVVGRHYRF
jgi:hypothetical protein